MARCSLHTGQAQQPQQPQQPRPHQPHHQQPQREEQWAHAQRTEQRVRYRAPYPAGEASSVSAAASTASAAAASTPATAASAEPADHDGASSGTTVSSGASASHAEVAARFRSRSDYLHRRRAIAYLERPWRFEKFARAGDYEGVFVLLEQIARDRLREQEMELLRQREERYAAARARGEEPVLEVDEHLLPFHTLSKKAKQRVRRLLLSDDPSSLRVMGTLPRVDLLDAFQSFCAVGHEVGMDYVWRRLQQIGLPFDEEIASRWMDGIIVAAMRRRNETVDKRIKEEQEKQAAIGHGQEQEQMGALEAGESSLQPRRRRAMRLPSPIRALLLQHQRNRLPRRRRPRPTCASRASASRRVCRPARPRSCRPVPRPIPTVLWRCATRLRTWACPPRAWSARRWILCSTGCSATV